MAPHRVRIDQQGVGDIHHPPTLAEQDHRMEAIGLTRIAHTPVRCTQFAEFLGSQLVICHAGQFNRLYRGLQSGCKPNFQIG